MGNIPTIQNVWQHLLASTRAGLRKGAGLLNSKWPFLSAASASSETALHTPLQDELGSPGVAAVLFF